MIKPIIEDKTASQINLGCSKKVGGPAITEPDLEFAKIGLRTANVQKKNIQKLLFKVLTAISCPLKALDRFT